MAMNPRLLRPLATGFNPKSIAGLALWLDASDTSTITKSTGASEWRDKSGLGKAFVQATGNDQPSTGTETMNGLNVLRFDGSNDFMTATDPFMTGTGNGLPFSVFIVQRIIAATNFGMTYTNGNGFEIRQDSTNGKVQVVDGFSTQIGLFNSSSVGVDDILTFIFPSGAANNLFYQRGTQLALLSNPTTKPSTTTSTHTIGRRTGGVLPVNARIAEIIAYNAQVSDSQRKAVEKYLGKKWGITVA